MTSKFKTREFTIDELSKLPRGCIWRGCTQHFSGNVMPPGWNNLLVWRTVAGVPEETILEAACSPHCTYDSILCPEHSKEMGKLLYPVLDPQMVGVVQMPGKAS